MVDEVGENRAGEQCADSQEGVLEGVGVLEVDTDVPTQHAGKLLVQLGARVTLAEPPVGSPVRRLPPFAVDAEDRERSVPFEVLNLGKGSVICDLDTIEGRDAVAALAADSRIVLIGAQAFARLRDVLRAPVIVVCSLYGQTDPDRLAVASTPFTRYAAGGDTSFLPTSHDRELRPTAPGRLIGEGFAGTGVLLAALHGLHRARASGTAQVIDFAEQAYLLTLNKMFIAQASYFGAELSRFTHTYPFGGNVPCSDGLIAMLVLETTQWEGLAHMVGAPEWLEDERYQDGIARRRNGGPLDAAVKAWCAARTTSEVLEAARAHDVPAGLVSTAAQLVARPSLRRRGAIVESETRFGTAPLVGLPFGRGFGEPRIPARAPELGATVGEDPPPGSRRARATSLPAASSTRTEHPLRVLDLTWAGAGPIISWTLATMGAEVAKIEHPRRPDLLRRANRTYGWKEDDDLDGSPAFNELNANKRSVVVDLGSAAGRRVVADLAARCDVLCESMRPGKVASLGLGYEAVREVNPSVVYCSLSATGRGTGERDDVSGYAPIFWAEGGGAFLSGWPQAAPDYVRSPVDMHAGSFACAGILAALERRDRTGEGAYVDLSAIEAVVCTTGDALLATSLGVDDGQRHGNERAPWLYNDVLPCAGDNRWVAVSIADTTEWAALCETLGVSEPAPAPAVNGNAGYRSPLARASETWNADELEDALQRRGLAASRVNSMRDLIDDPHLRARGYWQDVPHAVLGDQRLSSLAWRIEGEPAAPLRSAPLLDADTDAVLADWLGLDASEIADLRSGGGVGGRQADLAGAHASGGAEGMA